MTIILYQGVVACHKRLYYTLTRTSKPNYTSHRKDIKYETRQWTL